MKLGNFFGAVRQKLGSLLGTSEKGKYPDSKTPIVQKEKKEDDKPISGAEKPVPMEPSGKYPHSESPVVKYPPANPPVASGRGDYTPAGAEKSEDDPVSSWHDELGDFLGGSEKGVSSSNVASGQYNARENYLQLGFNNGGRYGYHDVSPQEATSFFSAKSKGSWVWDNLRRRGTKFGYQKPYAYIAGQSQGYEPSYYAKDDDRELHRRIDPSGQDLEWTDTTDRKVPKAYHAPQHKDDGGTIHGSASVGDNVDVKARAGEFIVNKESSDKHRDLLEKINSDGKGGVDIQGGQAGGEDGHYNKGGVIGKVWGALQDYAGKMDGKQVGRMVGGSLGYGLGGPMGAIFGALMGEGMGGGASGGPGGPGGGVPVNPMQEAADMLKDAARHLSDAAQMLGGGPPPLGSTLSSSKWITNQSGTPQLFGPRDMPPTATAAPPEGGGMAGAAGPVGLAIMGAMAVKAASDKVFESFHKLVDVVPSVTEGFMGMIGIPESMAETFGAAANLLMTPLHMAGQALHWLASPIEMLKDPFAMFKIGLTAAADVGVALAKTLWDMRDPVSMLTQAVGPFISQVSKFNPASVERMNLAFDNLSAAAGYIFEPIIVAVGNFADELNQAYTAIGEPIRGLVGKLAEMGVGIGREMFSSLFSIIEAGIPVVQNLITGLEPFAPTFRMLMGGFTELTVNVVRIGGELFSKLMSFIGPMIPAGERLLAIWIEGVRTAGTLWEAWRTIIGAGWSLVGSLFGFGVGLDSTLSALQLFAANVSAIAGVISRVADDIAHPIEATQRRLDALLRGEIYTPFNGFNDDVSSSLARMREAGQANPLIGQGGPMTAAAQPARQVGIEQVGMEARAAAFSQQSSVQDQILAENQQMSQTLNNISAALARFFPQLGNVLNGLQIAGQGVMD